MAYAQDRAVVKQFTHEAFDKIHKPGDIVEYSGIYRCEYCTHEIVSTEDNKFPPQTHPAHPEDKPIRWKLIVAPVHNS